MTLEDNAERLPKIRLRPRAHPRCKVDEYVSLLLVHQSTTVQGQIIELSLGGCRIRTTERFLAGTMARVEVIFKMMGEAFRFCGVTQWTDGKHLVGIRFLDLSARKREELRQLMDDLGKMSDEARSAAAESLAPFDPQGGDSAVRGDLNA